jgi:cytochrome d ubiquinol oxidase subunit I
MQTPVGHVIVDGRFLPQDWWRVIFNPSFPNRLVHTAMAFFITTAFVVIGVAGYYLSRNRFVAESLTMQKMGLGLLAILVPLQVLVGDMHGLNTLEHQPVKIAAMEANWNTMRRMPLLLFAWPDEKAERNLFEIGIPGAGSLILRHHVDGEVRGLKDWKPEDRPPVAIPFFSFRLMVASASRCLR